MREGAGRDGARPDTPAAGRGSGDAPGEDTARGRDARARGPGP